MISVLRKVAQLNIQYKKKWGLKIDVCTGVPPDEITALCLVESYLFVFVFILVT